MTFLGPVRVLLGVVLILGASSNGQDNPHAQASPEKPAPSGEEVQIEFDLHPKFRAILVKVDVNKKPALMIVDTGSSRTILDPRFLDLDLDSREAHKRADIGKGSGVAGDGARWGTATIEIGTHRFAGHRVVVVDMQDVSRNFQRTIDGLLGQDILCEFDRVVVDFSRSKIILGTRRRR